MTIGKGIAIAGIWLGVGMCGLGGVAEVGGIAFFAALATWGICEGE